MLPSHRTPCIAFLFACSLIPQPWPLPTVAKHLQITSDLRRVDLTKRRLHDGGSRMTVAARTGVVMTMTSMSTPIPSPLVGAQHMSTIRTSRALLLLDIPSQQRDNNGCQQEKRTTLIHSKVRHCDLFDATGSTGWFIAG